MNVTQILNTLDELFATNQVSEVEPYLTEQLTQALSNQESDVALTILNELIGFYRSVSRTNDSLVITDKALMLADSMGLKHSISYATTLLNGATAYRAAGHLNTAFTMYNETLSLYTSLIEANDYRFASLYNNMSSLMEEKQEYDKALDYLTKALSILSIIGPGSAEEAVTLSNMALIYIQRKDLSTAKEYLSRSIVIFHKLATKNGGNTDAHYSGALAALANIYASEGEFSLSMSTFQEALSEIKAHFGENHSYHLVKQNYQSVCEQAGFLKTPNGLSLSQRYYEAYGKPMIAKLFPEYENRIAIGLVGHGSECFGFDDELSADHDYGPSFCMWLTKEDYDAIGTNLQEAYDSLPKEFEGKKARTISAHGEKRIGVLEIESFYQSLLGSRPHSILKYSPDTFEEEKLALATNGRVFYDPLGVFCKIRSHLLGYYSEKHFTALLATQLAVMAQAGQYNYPRLMMRGEEVAALLSISEFITATIRLVHLLNKEYTPYYKWMHKSLRTKPILGSLAEPLEDLAKLPSSASYWEDATKDMDVINRNDPKVQLIEKICSSCCKELRLRQYTSTPSDFLEHHAMELQTKI